MAPASDPVAAKQQTWLRGHWPALVVWAFIAIYIAYFGTLTIQQHNAFQTTAFDLGNVDQAVWNTRHGRPFFMTNIEGLTNRLGTHVEPILLPISALYLVWSDPRALLLLQTVGIALGAWPLFLLARRAFQTRAPDISSLAQDVLPVIFGLIYLLFPALQSANAFDFHAVSLAPTLFLFALYYLETEHWGLYALFAILTMSCKEDMPLLVAMLGIYALIVKRKWLAGLLTLVVAGIWFLVAVGWIMPLFDMRGVSPLANRYSYLGDGPIEMAIGMLTQPGLVLDHLFTANNLLYVLKLLAPVAFLSLLAPQVLMLAIPPLLVNLLSTDGFMHELEGFHYGVTLVPIVVVSAAYGAAWLSQRLARYRFVPWLLATAVLVMTFGYHYAFGFTPLAADFSGWPTVSEHHHRGEEIAELIPTEASLAALPFPNPHASQRQQLSMIDRIENGRPAPLHDAEYIWLDVTHGWPIHPNDLKSGVENLLAGEYGVNQAVDGWLLLQRGAEERTLPDSFYDFARANDPQPQFPMQMQFLLDGEPVLESLGFDLDYDKGARTHSLTLYWRALQPLPPGLSLYPFFLDDASGEILEDTRQRPMIESLWYPPHQWQVGQVIRTSTLPWNVGSSFSIGLGAVQGADWDDTSSRLPIEVLSSQQVIRLFDGDTWARLLQVEDNEPVPETRNFEAPSPKHALDVDFGGQIRLRGYDLECARRDSACNLALYWQAQTRPNASYTVFAQLVDETGRVQSQVDAVPLSGGYPTQWWLPGEVVIDSMILPLPEDAAAETTYRLIAGLYDSDTGSRLPVVGGSTDYIDLTKVEP